MDEALQDFGMGWLPDYSDFRDSFFAGQLARLPEGEDRDVPTLLQQLGVAKSADKKTLAGFSPISIPSERAAALEPEGGCGVLLRDLANGARWVLVFLHPCLRGLSAKSGGLN